MNKTNSITLEYVQRFFDLAKAEFSFLTEQGFMLIEEKRAAGISFRDGFHFRYSRPPVDIVVDYYDMELVPIFYRGKDEVSYYFIDRYLFSNTSGYAGAMFPLDKLATPIRNIANDIKQHYGLVLVGDDATWKKIMALLNAPTEKRVLP
jgi:hypothetical protein